MIVEIDKDQNEHDEFYSILTDLYRKHRSASLVFICGDFNAEIGAKKPDESSLGSHFTQHPRNEQGNRLVQFGESHDLFFCNTAFEQSSSCKITHRAINRNGDEYSSSVVGAGFWSRRRAKMSRRLVGFMTMASSHVSFAGW